MITIVITYVKGTQDMMKVCLASLKRHDAGLPYKIKIITDIAGFHEAMLFLPEAVFDYSQVVLGLAETIKSNTIIRCASGTVDNITLEAFNLGVIPLAGSTMHGTLLDASMQTIDTDYILTLDSDCFPVADGWLKTLMDMQDAGATLSGILWPWIPSPQDITPKEIEYRIRKFHCWKNTQVACQLVKTSFVRDNKLSFTPGDDTSYNLSNKVWQSNGVITGLMPSCCALPGAEGLDPEYNRHKCVIYGDLIYHQGGATRQTQGTKLDPFGFYTAATERVFKEQGAEWVLKECHRYKFDKEEEVAQYKMRSMFQEMVAYLHKNDSLFANSLGNKI